MAPRRSNHSVELEQEIYQAVLKHNRDCGYPPSIREICEAVGIKSTSHVKYYLDRLAAKGAIESNPRHSRSARLPKAGFDMVQFPITSVIQAGTPINIPSSDFGHFDPETCVEISERFLPRKHDDLVVLKVQGDSMIDALIADGDLVVIKKTLVVNNGDMVAAWIESKQETTLKYYFLEKGTVRLQPANVAFEPILVDPTDVKIEGVVVHVMRSMGKLM